MSKFVQKLESKKRDRISVPNKEENCGQGKLRLDRRLHAGCISCNMGGEMLLA